MIDAKPTNVMLLGAAIFFAACWFAPVVAVPDPSTIMSSAPQVDVYPGWKAFWVVLGLLWSKDGPDNWSDLSGFVIDLASAFTNLVFLFAFSAVVLRWTAVLRPLQWAVLVSGALNLVWLSMGEHLMIGYYIWIAAFCLLFAAMARRSVK